MFFFFLFFCEGGKSEDDASIMSYISSHTVSHAEPHCVDVECDQLSIVVFILFRTGPETSFTKVSLLLLLQLFFLLQQLFLLLPLLACEQCVLCDTEV